MMKAKTIMCCILASVLMAGTAALNVSAVPADDDNDSVALNNTETSEKLSFEWDRSDNNGITIDIETSIYEAVIIRNNRLFASTILNPDLTAGKGQITIGTSLLSKLDDGENTIELMTKDNMFPISINVTNNHPEEVPDVSENSGETSENEFVLRTDNTVFEWDRNGGSDIAIMTNSSSSEVAVRHKLKFDSSLAGKSVSINDGQVIISSDFLKTLDIGENDVELFLKEGIININVIVSDSTPQEPSEEKGIIAEETNFTWDRNELIGIAVKTNSGSDNVRITKDGELLASNDNAGVYIAFGRVGITANILKKLDDGDNDLMLEFDDGALPINIHVTDSKNQDKPVLVADETDFIWSRDSESGIVIQVNSESKSFTVKKNNVLFASSLISNDLSIENGQILLDTGFLKKLDNGENHLTLILKEGSIDINITVSDDGGDESSEISVITADKTYFTWDRSDLIGIAVKTNSKTQNVVITKDGEPVFSNEDMGVYVTFGRVGITSQCLKKLENGENKLVFEFDDGNLPVTINVTDRKNKSGSETGLTSDKTVFTWRKNSSDGISVKTNSVSSTASVRKSGMFSLVSDPDSIYIKSGTVTLTPAYLNKLSDGKNNLTLVLEDGSIDITVNVIGNVIDQSNTFQSSSYISSGSEFSGDYPYTGSTVLLTGVAVTAASAATAGIIASKKRKKHSNKKEH